MFKLFAVATYALATLSAVSGVAIVRDSKPATYNENVLESYSAYHSRYMTLSCNNKHNTQFFDDCCHPMLKTETLANNRKPYCNPASASVVSSAAQPTPTGDDDDDCDDGDDETTVAPTPTPTPTPSPASPSPSPVETTSAVHTSAPQPPKAPSSSKTPKPQATPAPSTGNGQEYEGKATYFLQNNTPGACGKVHADSDYIVALDYRTYGNTSQRSQYCGKQVVITDENSGKTVTATVADACPTCGGPGYLDLSEGLFQAFHALDVGEFKIKWHFA